MEFIPEPEPVFTYLISINKEKDGSFIHFDSISHLNKFVNIFNTLTYGHKCCGGKGIKIIGIADKETSDLKL